MTVDRNIDVRCIRSQCETSFVTSFDSFMSKMQISCPKCKESWAVHMIDGEDRIIHPTEMCPICMSPALLEERCRCSRYCIKCKNDHQWHTCAVHKKQVAGGGHEPHLQSGCTCNAP